MTSNLSPTTPPGHWRCVFRLEDAAARLVLNVVVAFGCEAWARRLTGTDFLIGTAFKARHQADQWANAEVDRARRMPTLPRSAVIYLRAEYLLDEDA